MQGGELDALRGALRTLDQAVNVTVEMQIFSERDTLVELLSFMQGRGWALYELTEQLPGWLAQLRERRARNLEAIEELLANA